ncbi:MAG: sigma-70 family RNA polymerase sigma factor [Bryobacterales bacterium]|jgi:RNA polymerase sigma factor (TIGR02999 family)
MLNDGTESGQITALLNRISTGDPQAQQALIDAVYAPLKGLAAAQLRRERPDHTLQTTALVHEAYIRLIQHDGITLRNRAHFFAIAARVMRRVLIDYARARKSDKRGGGQLAVELHDGLQVSSDRVDDILVLDEALSALAGFSTRLAQVVELRFFGGLTVEESAEVLGISPRQVKRDWKLGRSWLKTQLAVRP